MYERGIENIRYAIIEQAVYDYIIAVRNIALLNMKCYQINRIVEEGRKDPYKPKYYTVEEAENKRQYRLTMEIIRLNEVEGFFRSQWYDGMCDIGYDEMLMLTKEKSIDEIVDKCIFGLKRVKPKNISTKKSQKALFEYQVLMNFLKSEYLQRFTSRTAEEILEYIKSESKCEYV